MNESLTCQLLLGLSPGLATATDESGRTPLYSAATAGSSAAVRLLLAAAPQAATTARGDGMLPLHVAASLGGVEVVELLLRAVPQSASVTAADGWCAAHVAAAQGHASVLRMLLHAELLLTLNTMAGPRWRLLATTALRTLRRCCCRQRHKRLPRLIFTAGVLRTRQLCRATPAAAVGCACHCGCRGCGRRHPFAAYIYGRPY